MGNLNNQPQPMAIQRMIIFYLNESYDLFIPSSMLSFGHCVEDF